MLLKDARIDEMLKNDILTYFENQDSVLTSKKSISKPQRL